MRRTKAMIMTTLMSLVMFNNIAYASESVVVEENEITIFEDAKDEKYVNMKVEEEKKNKTELLDNKTERYLNENGLFDEEIEKLDDETLEELMKSSNKDIQVYTSFYEYIEPDEDNSDADDNSENETVKSSDDTVIAESSLVELTKDEINAVIAEKYYDVDISEMEEKDDNTVLDDVLEAVGLKPVNVYAYETINSVDNSDNMKGTYLKKSILIVPEKLGNKQYYKLITNYTWLTMPENRMLDVAIVSWDDNAKQDNSNIAYRETYAKVTTDYTDTVRRQLTGELLSTSHGTEEKKLIKNYVNENSPDLNRTLDSGNVAITNHRMYAFVDLMDDTLVPKDYERKVYRREVNSINIMMCTYIRKVDDSDNVTIGSYYFHTRAKQVYDIKGLKYQFTSHALNITQFILRNLDCVKDKITVVREKGDCEKKYFFK